MDDIENYQARIHTALDRITENLTGQKGRLSEADHDRQREAALIEDLRQTLSDERADLAAERANAARLSVASTDAQEKVQAVEAEKATLLARLSGAEAALDEANEAKSQALAAQEAAEAARDAVLSEKRALEQSASQSEKEHARQETTEHNLQARIERLTARIENQDIQFQRLKDANAQLRESNAVLRERNAANVGDPDAINQSLQAELDALKTTRAADVEEMDTILEELKPLVEGKINA